MSARFLIRLDDACPTWDRPRWDTVKSLLASLDIRPIVAVIPDNRDPELHFAPDDEGFWPTIADWQSQGWTIGLHGFRHELAPAPLAGQYLPFYRKSEFAGRPAAEQRAKIAQGYALLISRGINPTVWVAPAHSFDRATLDAVRDATSIRTVSDGIARDQFQRDGFRWLPQQLWSLEPRRSGLWTVCVHPNSMNDADLAGFERAVTAMRPQIVGVADLPVKTRGRTIADHVEEARFWVRHVRGKAIGAVRDLIG